MKYNRILLKLSGEALMGDQSYGIDSSRLSDYAKEIKQIVDKGIQVAVVLVEGIFIEVFNQKELVLTEFRVIIWVC